MDQDSFRRLLQAPRPAGASSGTTPTGSNSRANRKTIDASQPAFKPRKVKKETDAKYRDRAGERRVGEGNDYAQVEAVLEDFEKRNANNQDRSEVEAQRKYLGGDSDHSILVKGLDFALLEQNKARATNIEDDDSLEQAFLESSSHPTTTSVPKKRTRDDLLRELKEKRLTNGAAPSQDSNQKSVEEEARVLEEAKKSGKFKPIGFKPIGGAADEKGKKKKAKGEAKAEGDRKKKKRKLAENSIPPEAHNTGEGKGDGVLPPRPAPPPSEDPEETLPDDFDIFAGAGEYEGIDLEDDDEEDESPGRRPDRQVMDDDEEQPSSTAPRRWIESDEPVPAEKPKPDLLVSVLKAKAPPSPPTRQDKGKGKQQDAPNEEEESDQPVRLQALESSALPSIKDFLALDNAVHGSGKWKNKKNKKKGDGGGTEAKQKQGLEAKVDRDYQRLKNYTEQKGGK